MTASRPFNTDALGSAGTVTGILSAADLRTGEIIAGRYRIERLLGMGGMGVVYQARDIELDVDVALKVLRPELASRPDAFERFRQELLLARQVSSPHVVRIHDLVKHGPAWLISMDYVAGHSLERLLDKEGALAPERAIGMIRQLAQGLAAAHHRGVVHRDLKPANVLVDERGDAAITDFGVARSAGNTGITGSGVIIGTPEYLSPEQAKAEPVDGRSDLYALGLIFYEMLTGTLPFRGGTPAEMLAQRILRDPPPVDSVKPKLPSFTVRLCSRLLELKPSRRFQTAADVIRAIDTRRVPGSALPRARTLKIAAALVVIAALGAGGVHEYRALRSQAAAVAARTLDFAMLPMSVDDKADAELALGVGRRFANALSAAGGSRSADALRVDRALIELGYDGAAAVRHRARVAQAIGARELLEGSLARNGDGLVVTLTLRDPEREPPIWTLATPPTPAAALPAALQTLQAAVQARLGIAGTVAAWPPTTTLAAIGAYAHTGAKQVDFAAALKQARDTSDPVLWWALLDSLDRSGHTADTVSSARAAKDALAGATDPAALRTRAYAMLLLGENAEADQAMSEVTRAAPADNPALLVLARARGELGDFDKALALLQTLVADDPRNVDAWYFLGKYSIQAGDAKRAVDDYLVRAQILSNRLDDKKVQADVSNALGIGYRRVGQMAQAADQLAKAAQQREAIGDLRGQAASLRNLATVRSIQGDFAAADTTLAKARAIVDALGDASASADMANDAGLLAEERGDYRKALAQYREALNLRQSGGDARLVGESLINVGFSYYQIGEFDNAQIYSKQAEATYAKTDDRAGAVHARQNIALVDVARGDWANARATQVANVRDAEEFQMAEERTVSVSALAELDRLEGNFESALKNSAAALDDFGKREDPRGTTEMKLLRSASFCDLGDWDEADAALADLGVDAVENGEQASLLAWRRGEIALGRGNASSALSGADDAIARAQSAHSYGSELSARLLRARALLAQTKPGDAKRELARVEDGLAHYASVPLRLQLFETSLRVAPEKGVPAYREARALLARLPAYGRAFRLHAAGADALERAHESSGEARRAASEALAAALAQTPLAQRGKLAAAAASAGITVDAAKR